MTVNGTSFGSVGTAAMAYVAHITNHPALCEFFLKVGIVGIILSIIGSIVAGIVKGCNKEK